MAIAHVCTACGADLAFTRPRIDPVYGLPLVRCPGCGSASVRRTHPLWRWWSAAQAAAGALAVLFLKVLAAMGLWMLTLYATKAVMDAAGAFAAAPQDRDPWVIRVAAGVCVAAALGHGIWITAGLGHLRRRTAWLGWAAVLYGATGAVTVLFDILSQGASRAQSLRDGRGAAIVFAAVLLAAPLGMPAGRALRRALRGERLRRLRRIRAPRRRQAVRA